MRELSIAVWPINSDVLDASLKAALGAKYISISGLGPSQAIIVRVTDSATPADEATVASVCAAHDPTPTPDPILALLVAVAQAKAEAGSTPIDNLTVTGAIAYINSNVTDLASAKAALVIAVKFIGEMRRELNAINHVLGINGG